MSRLKRIVFLYFILGLNLGVLLALPPSVLACSPVPGYQPPSLIERTADARYVIKGEVKEVLALESDLAPWASPQVIFSVNQWLKGSGPDEIQVTGFDVFSSCGTGIPRQGVEIIVFLRGDVSTGKLSLNNLGINDAIVSVTPQNIAEILHPTRTLIIYWGKWAILALTIIFGFVFVTRKLRASYLAKIRHFDNQ